MTFTPQSCLWFVAIKWTQFLCGSIFLLILTSFNHFTHESHSLDLAELWCIIVTWLWIDNIAVTLPAHVFNLSIQQKLAYDCRGKRYSQFSGLMGLESIRSCWVWRKECKSEAIVSCNLQDYTCSCVHWLLCCVIWFEVIKLLN